MKNAIADLIARQNVYKFDGPDKFEDTLKLLKETILEVHNESDVSEKIDYYLVLARFYVFDVDPDAEDLDTEKN